MATAASMLQSLRTSAHEQRTKLGWRDNFVTLVLAFWLMIGLFVDGWAHNNLDTSLETFFTPWHALFYSGFAANAMWLQWLIFREWRTGKRGLAAIPQGYHIGAIGVVIFGIGGVGDMIWHIVFGIEQDIEALLSPTHLLIFLGGVMIFASPFLAGWQSSDPAEDAPRLRSFLPTLGSITMMTSFVSFMNMYLWAMTRSRFAQPSVDRLTRDAGASSERLFFFSVQAGLAEILITSVVLLAPVLLLLLRWRLPFGSITFLFTLNTLLMSAIGAFQTLNIVLVMFVAGLIVDGLIHWTQRWPDRTAAFRLLAVAIPLVIWGLRFGEVALFGGGVAWSLELSAGITVMASLAGLGLSLLMLPPQLPDRIAAR